MSKIYLKPNPCKPNCERRTAACHSNCPDYDEWVKSGVEVPKKTFFNASKRRKQL